MATCFGTFITSLVQYLHKINDNCRLNLYDGRPTVFRMSTAMYKKLKYMVSPHNVEIIP